MAPAEVIQPISTPLSSPDIPSSSTPTITPICPCFQSPLNSPGLQTSSPPFTLNDVQQFVEMVKAVVAMQNTPAATPHCSCSTMLLESLSLQMPSTPLTIEHLEKLRLKIIKETCQSPGSCSQTPPNSPGLQIPSPPVTREDLKQLLLEVIQAKNESSGSVEAAESVTTDDSEDTESEKEIVRASRFEFKLVNEVWDAEEHKYKIVKSVTAKEELDELEEYIFVVRVRIDKKTGDPTFYVDIKSPFLQEILGKVLQGVKGLCLGGDKPTVERNLLYHYLPELEAYRRILGNDHPSSAHLDLLIKHIKEAYKTTTQQLIPLLDNDEITYDLLWALFKPGSVAYATCSGTQKPRCIRYDFGEEIAKDDIQHFQIEGRYFDFDGNIFGENRIFGGIVKFRGARPINTLGIFPLSYHPQMDKIRTELIECGRKFISLKGIHHFHYSGRAFRMKKGNSVAVSVNSKILVDPALFWKLDPNYSRPRLNLPKSRSRGSVLIDVSEWDDLSSSKSALSKMDAKDLSEVDDNDLVLCSPTVLGYSLTNKMWLEFAVADIAEITWNLSLFEHLEIQPKTKRLIQALTKSHITSVDDQFDDFVEGKGRGLLMLLYGPPGVGKTLTAEAISEHLQRPLYMISAGDLSNDPKVLETQLSHIFECAERWKAVLLLDEADVYLSQRLTDRLHNSLVSIFLRMLEYYEGIMFLTTNRLTEFDEAILSRVHLTLKYSSLSTKTKKAIWKGFLGKAVIAEKGAIYSPEQLDDLAKMDFNGRGIKNCVRAAHALATEEGVPLSYSHLRVVIESGAELQNDFRGAGQVDNLRSYM